MKIVLPELGEGISNVEIRDVLVKEGDTLSKDDTILILETDKASMEIPSEIDGVISKVYVKSGDTISPNDIILSINTIDEDRTEEIKPFKNNIFTERVGFEPTMRFSPIPVFETSALSHSATSPTNRL